MTNSRRDFLKKVALVSGGAGMWSALPPSIQKAMAIAPDPGTTFYDAEHVVLLMQENRSFDHCFGTLRGVRGFNDPFPVALPGKIPVWFQPDKSGNRFLPFRLNIKDTRATWMGGVAHSWADQVDARNEGKYDGWIEAKRPGNEEFKNIPLTMGYYTRQDIPFYYALADAFTVCDQHFCSSLTGTTTNRTYFWTGKTHGAPGEKPRVRNGELTYEKMGAWTTFPERLEEHGISWRVYQNEISLPCDVEDESLLGNFTDNNLEWFSQYGVFHHAGFHDYLVRRKRELEEEIAASGKKTGEELVAMKKELSEIKAFLEKANTDRAAGLSARARSLHDKAFTTNTGDPDYHRVEEMTYTAEGKERTTKVPKGDILHQFRKDVQEKKLPTVSWLVAPKYFSDHPSAPWYGAWYVSEVLDILTQNPEVWKKTIFILNYDENDGYFDHIPPFVPPDPMNADSGRVGSGIDVTGEYVTVAEEMKSGFREEDSRTSPVGLGFRVPLVIASPWSRGGWVNSEVCDLTSPIRFLEKFLSKKSGKKIEEPNISSWRRTVSGDLTSAFRPYNGEKMDLPEWLNRNKHIQEIYNARFKELPDNYRALTEEEARESSRNPLAALPQQESGTKPSNALKYELYADGRLSGDKKDFIVTFKAGNKIFGASALGSAFNVCAPGNYLNKATGEFDPVKTWAFAVKSGSELEYRWPLEFFEGGKYYLRVYGPNGFFREFRGNSNYGLEVACAVASKGNKLSALNIEVRNQGTQALTLRLVEEKYRKNESAFSLSPGAGKSFTVDTTSGQGWYDFSVVSSEADAFGVRYAGRLETGKDGVTDPYMGRGSGGR